MKEEEIPGQKSNVQISHKGKYFQNAFWATKNTDSKRLSKKNTAPRKRWGHSSVFFENSMYIFGGSSQSKNTRTTEPVFVLNCESFEWEKIPPVADQPGPELRDSHSCVVIGHSMIIYGGSNSDKTFDDMWSFNFYTKTWSKITPEKSADIPCQREGHSCCPLNDRYIYIYGGWDSNTLLDDSYLFDTKTKIWQKVTKSSGDDPGARDSQTCSLVKDTMYIFGGQGNAKNKVDTYFNDLYKIKLNITALKTTSHAEKVIPRDPSHVPSFRTSHSASVYKDKYIFIIGGEGYENENMTEFEEKVEEPPVGESSENKNENSGAAGGNSKTENEAEEEDEEDHKCYPKSDVWLYDCEMNSWSQIVARNNEIFIPRFAHSSCIFKDSIIIFGGLKDYVNSTDDLLVLNLEEDLSLKKKTSDLCPVCKRYYIKDEANEDEAEEIPKEKPHPILSKETRETRETREIKEIRDLKEQKEHRELRDHREHKDHGGHKDLKDNKEKAVVEGSSNKLAIPNTMVSVSYLSSIANLTSWPFSAIGLLVANAFSIDASEMRINLIEDARFHFGNEGYSAPQQRVVEPDPSSIEIKEEKDEKSRPIPDSALAERNDLNRNMEQLIENEGAGNLNITEKVEGSVGGQSNTIPLELAAGLGNQNSNMNVSNQNQTGPSSGNVVNAGAARKIDGDRVHYLLIQDKGKPWEPQEFLQIFFNFRHDYEGQTSHHAEYGNFLKLGALRLGETFLFISRTEKKVSMGFLSSNRRYNAHVNDYTIFFTAYDLENNQPLTDYYNQRKKNIVDSVRHFLKEKDMTPEAPGNYLYITDLKRTIFKDEFGFELMSSGIDVIYQSSLKLKCLDEVKNWRSNLIDYSLRKYLSFFFLKPPLNFKVILQNRDVAFFDYEEILNQQREKLVIKEIDVGDLKECGDVRFFVTTRFTERLTNKDEKPKEVKKVQGIGIEQPSGGLYNDHQLPSLQFSHPHVNPIGKQIPYTSATAHRPWPFPGGAEKFMGGNYPYFSNRSFLPQQQQVLRRNNEPIVIEEEEEDRKMNAKDEIRRNSEKKDDTERSREEMSEEKTKRPDLRREERGPDRVHLPENHQGILIYSKHQLVTRYETKRLGELDSYLNKRFGKSKYGTAFDYMGFIELGNFFDKEVNILKNEITSSIHYSLLTHMIDHCIKNYEKQVKSEKSLKHRNEELPSDEPRKLIKHF